MTGTQNGTALNLGTQNGTRNPKRDGSEFKRQNGTALNLSGKFRAVPFWVRVLGSRKPVEGFRAAWIGFIGPSATYETKSFSMSEICKEQGLIATQGGTLSHYLRAPSLPGRAVAWP